MVKGFDLFLAGVDAFLELVCSVEVLGDVSIFGKFFDFFKLFVNVDQLLVKEFLFVLEFLR